MSGARRIVRGQSEDQGFWITALGAAQLLVLVLGACFAQPPPTGLCEPFDPLAMQTPIPDLPIEPSEPGDDFIADAKLLFRVAACGGRSELPQNLRAQFHSEHCRRLAIARERVQKRWQRRKGPFFRSIIPSALPPEIVYPFFNGDIHAALQIFPDLEAKEELGEAFFPLAQSVVGGRFRSLQHETTLLIHDAPYEYRARGS